MKTWSFVLIWIGLVSAAIANASSSWTGYDDPANMDPNYEYRLDYLPKNNVLPTDQIPWSETYWPTNKGSINIRWNAPGRPGFGYHSPSRDQVATMSRDQLAQLSPTEKYDLAMGHYDYPMKNYISKYSADSSADDWNGICDGWSIASTQKKEPRPVDITNPDGVVIPFGSSDVKGLMSYYAIKVFDPQRKVAGKWCGRRIRDCAGINAGAYHVILANQLGLKKEAFAVNISRNHEIWNQPVYGFQYEIVGSALSDNAYAAYRIKSKMIYTDELEFSRWEPVTGTVESKNDKYENEYVIELDRDGKITGGYWLSGNHPQLFWKASKQLTFDGDFAGLNQIYQPI